MEKIGILYNVCQLFSNIGWKGLLKWDDVGYKHITLNFLSSITIHENVVRFSLFNNPCTLRIHQISNMIRAITHDHSPPFTPTPLEYIVSDFWTTITGERSYVVSNAKGLQLVNLIYPVFLSGYRWSQPTRDLPTVVHDSPSYYTPGFWFLSVLGVVANIQW